jgi:hypothetical protein
MNRFRALVLIIGDLRVSFLCALNIISSGRPL